MCYVFHLLRCIPYTNTYLLVHSRLRAQEIPKPPHFMSKQPNRGKRNRSIQFWCDQQEFESIKKLSDQAGISRGNYCRQVVLGQRPQHIPQPGGELTRQEIKELHKEIRAIGTNLNQLAKHANSTHELPHLEKIESGIEAYNDLNRSILEALR